MSRKKILIIALIIFITFIPRVALGDDEILKFNKVSIDKNIKVNEDILALSQNTINRGIIVGDLVTISRYLKNYGIIKGDILGLGTYINSYGIIKGNLRVISERVIVGGEVYKNVSTLSKRVTLEKGGFIDGSITALCDTLEINGSVGTDIRGKVDTLIINGEVKGDVNVTVNNIIFGTNGKIKGTLNYKSKNEITLPLSNIHGGVEYSKLVPLGERFKFKKNLRRLKIILNIIKAGGLILVGLVFILGFPKLLEKFKVDYKYLKEKPFKVLGMGILITVSIPLISIILICTIIGLPLGLITLAIYLILVYLVKIPVSIFIGKLIFKGKINHILSFIFSVILLILLTEIPFIGIVINLLILIFGFSIYYINFAKLKSSI